MEKLASDLCVFLPHMRGFFRAEPNRLTAFMKNTKILEWELKQEMFSITNDNHCMHIKKKSFSRFVIEFWKNSSFAFIICTFLFFFHREFLPFQKNSCFSCCELLCQLISLLFETHIACAHFYKVRAKAFIHFHLGKIHLQRNDNNWRIFDSSHSHDRGWAFITKEVFAFYCSLVKDRHFHAIQW